MIDSSIFNTSKDYSKNNGSLFLQAEPGLLDSINKSHPELWRLYKLMKKLDWDENEFDFSSCISEFQTCSKDEYEIMIMTLSWQWQADSVASHSIAPVVAPFVSSSELWALWSRISENEVLHGLTYSEIVRGSFTDPDQVFKSVLGEVAAYQRLSSVAQVMANTKKVAAQLMLKQISRDSNEARDAIMLFSIAMLVLERVQFMSSFAITFAFGETGKFIPIAQAVQKICNDEYTVHVATDKEILRNELSLNIGRESFQRIKPFVDKLIMDVVNSELLWTEQRLFQGGRQLPGCTSDMVKDWVLFAANDVYNVVGLKNPYKIITKNPISFIDDWIKINNSQASPQEQDVGNYLLGGFKNNTDGKTYDLDF